jgi:DedD protein
MAFFKFRKAADEAAPAAAQTESADVLRKRARHRLIGAAVLVLVGLIGFPLLFDTQPRPVPVDIPIDIPDRNKVKPLTAPVAASAAVSSGQVSAPVAAAAGNKVAATEGLGPKEELVAPISESKVAQPLANTMQDAPKKEATVAKVEPKPEVKPEPKAVAKIPVKPDDGARAKALLEGKPAVATAPATAPAAASDERYVVQVGAFSDATKAREVRLKVERAGMKTYTQVIETKDGKRIRVRVGPFDDKAAADKAANKIKGLDLPAAILTL